MKALVSFSDLVDEVQRLRFVIASSSLSVAAVWAWVEDEADRMGCPLLRHLAVELEREGRRLQKSLGRVAS